MKISRRKLAAGLACTFAIAGFLAWWDHYEVRYYLTGSTAGFEAQFAPPTGPGSKETRAELDELLAMQQARTPAQEAAARADRKTRIERFYGALGIDANAPPALPNLHRLAQRVEDDVRIHVRVAKENFRRLRPYEIEPRLEPCIDDVRGDLSYPSGHAAYGYAMAYLLIMLVPEREQALEARADDFARQRMVCGVHFRSDLEAGRLAARQLLSEMNAVPEFREDAAQAGQELRAALGLVPGGGSGGSGGR